MKKWTIAGSFYLSRKQPPEKFASLRHPAEGRPWAACQDSSHTSSTEDGIWKQVHERQVRKEAGEAIVSPCGPVSSLAVQGSWPCCGVFGQPLGKASTEAGGGGVECRRAASTPL